MEISLNETVRAMSIALDLVEISSLEDKNIVETVSKVNYSNHEFANHSKRTAYIALQVASFLGLNSEIIKRLYLCSLLHDIGAANSLKYSHSSNNFIREHCIKGSEIIKPFPILHGVPDIILYHHENYNGTGPLNIDGHKIPIESQVIRIADLVELLYEENIPPYKQESRIIDWVTSHSNTIFSTEIVDAFLRASSTDKFWFDLENVGFIDSILDEISPNLDIALNLDEFETIACIFSNIIDSKSEFTATHSRGISDLAFSVSRYLGYSEEKCKKMRIAGLLHDIGKVAIPSKVLDKNGPLTKDEFSIIKSHVYYTSIILNKIENIKDISEWASNHHEKLNGKGYPRGLSSKDLCEESRIMAVCDIYQALTEDRPYRTGLNKDKAFEIMMDMASNNFICNDSLNHLKSALL
ncbi:HD domain-containing protein [Clostridium bovifaecis]|uniref:HD domain-containing protein n=1 Tax=Clostridium bovifaecis TaxID=2184719 RepID=A0A6I6F8V5_9CLOT|nr:HD domain-containing protein [Clostridium bovifaecis]